MNEVLVAACSSSSFVVGGGFLEESGYFLFVSQHHPNIRKTSLLFFFNFSFALLHKLHMLLSLTNILLLLPVIPSNQIINSNSLI
ncbi:hypothetical protein RIF29_11625 [Crotalaria pallida]|uniref:Uncharacterized protein n=1 Tax=Crotalaria pallida TaxID=3830 RepID=A0AAN9IMB5_CROPI